MLSLERHVLVITFRVRVYKRQVRTYSSIRYNIIFIIITVIIIMVIIIIISIVVIIIIVIM